MEKMELLQELARNQVELLEEYSRLLDIKQKFLLRFEEMKADLDKMLPQELGPPRDAFIDLPGRLNNYNLEKESQRIVHALSRIITHLATFE